MKRNTHFVLASCLSLVVASADTGQSARVLRQVVAIGPFDPLQPLVARMIEANVHDRWLTRRLAPFIANAGFRGESRQSHGYVAEGEAAYFLTVVDRGADTLAQEAVISDSTSEALKAEARRRVAEGAFFGFMSYLSVIASKPD